MLGNGVNLIGRLTKDPEAKTFGEDGGKVMNFTIARNRWTGKKAEHPEADFIDCVAWNKTAELIETYFKKGSLIGISGRLNTRSYVSDKYTNEDGNPQKVKVMEVYVESIEFLEKKSDGQDSGQSSDNTPDEPVDTTGAEDGIVDDSDDLPF